MLCGLRNILAKLGSTKSDMNEDNVGAIGPLVFEFI